jgi:hypothetical protein
VRQLLWVLLVIDVLQLLVALAALANGAIRSRRARAAPEGERDLHASLARYSLGHAALLSLGAAALAVPVVLGLTHVIDETIAVIVAVVLEVLALPLGRATLAGLERAHRGRVESAGT